MLQTILVYIIIILAVAFSGYAFIKSIRKKEEDEESPCGDCNGCDIKNEITKNATNKTTREPSSCGNIPKKSS